MRFVRPVLAGSLVLCVAFGALAPSAGADTVTDNAVTWLIDQQESDGGFELADFPPFETPDAALAIGANAQTTGSWSTAEARAAVEAVEFGGPGGPTPLDFLDNFAESVSLTPGTAAKLILLSALPFGDNPTAYDPSGDGTPVDLTATLDDIAPGLFNSFLFGRLAEAGLGQNVHQRDVQVICEAQKTVGGGWSFDALPSGPNAADIDTTAFAVMALRAAGVAATDPVLVTAETFIDNGQQASGAWLSFGSDDPNATAVAMLAWVALGNTLAELEEDPVAFIQGEQLTTPPADAGRIASPNDGFGVNTFATSQSVQALLLPLPEADWLPLDPEAGRVCLPPSTYTDVTPDAWFDDGARWVDAEDIVSGIGGELRPNGNVNRAQAAMWLNLVYSDRGGAPHPFTDVPDGAWYEDGVDFVGDAPNGPIANGFGTEFRPRVKLNRAQAVSWLYAMAGSPEVSGAPDFTDVPDDAWFADAAAWAQEHGIVLGFPDDTFRGNGNVRRAQFSQWMFNLAAEPAAWADDAEVPPTNLFGETL